MNSRVYYSATAKPSVEASANQTWRQGSDRSGTVSEHQKTLMILRSLLHLSELRPSSQATKNLFWAPWLYWRSGCIEFGQSALTLLAGWTSLNLSSPKRGYAWLWG